MKDGRAVLDERAGLDRETMGEKVAAVKETDLSEKGELSELDEDAPPPLHVFPILTKLRAVALVATLTAAMVLNILQTQSVIIALDHIGADLDITISNYQWLSSAYSLAFGSVLLLFGRLADIHGHKLVFLLGMAWFCVWSIGISLAPNEISADLFRAFQGMGAGAAIPSALGILGSSFAPSQAKSTAFAVFSGGAPLGGSLGGVFGGVFTQYASWRAIFYVSAGLAAVICFAGFFVIPPDSKRRVEDKSVDWVGGALITVGLVLMTFALADGSSAPNGWRTPYVPTLFSIGVILIVSFWFWEKHVEFVRRGIPLMRTSLWYKGRFAAVQLIAFFGWSAFSSYQDFEGLKPILTTIRFLPSPITGLFLNLLVALIAHLVPAQVMLILGGLGTGLAPLLFALQRVGVPYWEFQFPAMILIVFGADFIFATGIMYVNFIFATGIMFPSSFLRLGSLRYVSKIAGSGEQALAGGVFNMLTQVGTAFGLAIMTLIQTKVTAREVQRLGGTYDANTLNVPASATEKGLRAAFWGCVAFAFCAMAVAATCCWGIGKVGHKVQKPVSVEEGVGPSVKEP
ncbi:hypothetical protein P7C70_g4486, partial [Phenoliferia sp. Uapishka_3]